MKKTIITVVGKDTVGIIAKVCTYLAENKVNILDISQTIVDGYFNMMMITDTSLSPEKAGHTFRGTGRSGEKKSAWRFTCSMKIFLPRCIVSETAGRKDR